MLPRIGLDLAFIKNMSEQQLKKIVYILVSIAFTLILQACGRDLDPQESCNFVQNAKLQRVSWKGKMVKLYIHDSVPKEYIGEIKAAAKIWNEEATKLNKEERVLISIESVVGGPLNPQRDGYNIVYLMSDWEENKLTEQARTTIYWTGNRIYEADVRINKRHKFSAQDTGVDGNKIDMRSLMVHEFGHILGLSHVEPEKESVMHAHLAGGKERREISTYDKKSLKCEYM